MKTLDELLQACVMAINETGLEPQTAVGKTVYVYDDQGMGELVEISSIKWDASNDCFAITLVN